MARKKIKPDIFKDEKRGCYYVYLYYGKDANKKTIKSYATASSIKEAEQIRSEHKRKQAAGELIIPSNDTLIQHAEQYVNYKALTLASSTIYGYNGILNNHLRPYWKDQKIQDVTVQHIQTYVVKKSKSLSINSIKKHLNLLYSIFQDACRKGIINKNPVAQMEPLPTKKPDINCLNAEEIAALLRTLKDDPLELPVMLAAYLGLRRGEVLGLKWDCVDFDKAEIHIVNTLTQVGKKQIEKAPKTERSERTLSVCPELLKALKQQKHQQEQRIATRRYKKTNFVVTSKKGTPINPNYLSDAFGRHLKKHGLPHIRFHDLRHSFASIANAAGVSMNDISSAMGHTNISVTSSVYTHEFSQVKTKAANAVAASLSQAILPDVS